MVLLLINASISSSDAAVLLTCTEDGWAGRGRLVGLNPRKHGLGHVKVSDARPDLPAGQRRGSCQRAGISRKRSIVHWRVRLMNELLGET